MLFIWSCITFYCSVIERKRRLFSSQIVKQALRKHQTHLFNVNGYKKLLAGKRFFMFLSESKNGKVLTGNLSLFSLGQFIPYSPLLCRIRCSYEIEICPDPLVLMRKPQLRKIQSRLPICNRGFQKFSRLLVDVRLSRECHMQSAVFPIHNYYFIEITQMYY